METNTLTTRFVLFIFVLNVWLLIQTCLVFIVNVTISNIERKMLFPVSHIVEEDKGMGAKKKKRGREGYEGRGRKAWEVKVLERVGSRRNGGGGLCNNA